MTKTEMNDTGRRVRHLLCVLTMVSLWMLACGYAGAALVVGSEVGIGSTSVAIPRNQEAAAVAAGSSGYLVVWQDKRNQTDYDIYGIFVDTNGNPVGSESFLISTSAGAGAANDQIHPAVAFNGTSFLVVWVDRRAVNMVPHIYGTRVSTSGVVLDTEGIAVSATGTFDQSAPAVASNGTDWEVVWQENTAVGFDIYGARVTSTGTIVGRGGLANSADNNEEAPSLAWNGSYYLLTWQDYRAVEASGTDIYGCRLSSTGSKVYGSEVLISRSPTDPAAGALGNQINPMVSAVPSGNYLVVWQDARGGTYTDVYGGLLSSFGALTNGNIAISTVTNDQELPSVSWDGSNFLVVWRDKNLGRRIRGSRVTSAGSVLDPSGFSISVSAAGTLGGQFGPTVASKSGSSFVVWYTLDTTNADIRASKVTGTSATAEADIGISAQDQTGHAAAFDGTNYVVVWSDRRSGTAAIYASRIARDGTVLDPSGVPLAAPSGDQTQPAIAWSGTSYLVAWTEGAESSADIKGILIGPDLVPIGTAFNISAIVDVEQHSPSVAWNGTRYLAAWVDKRLASAPEYNSDIWGSRISSTGSVLDVLNICGAAGSQYSPSVTSDGSYFLIAWQDFRNPVPEIYSTRVSSTGTIDTLPLQVSIIPGSKYAPRVACDGTGYLATWYDNRNGWTNDIVGTRISTLNRRLDVNDIGICTQTSEQNSPSLAWNGLNYFASWVDMRNTATTCSDIYLIRVNSDGSILDPTDILISGKANPENDPTVVASAPNCGIVFYCNSIYSANRLVFRVLAEAPPAPVVTDDGLYTSSADTLHASWTPGPGSPEITEYKYAIGTTLGGSNIVDWTSIGSATSVTKTGLSLMNGATYYFSVKARNSAGVWGDPGNSDGITVDATPPTTPAVTDSGQYTSSTTTLDASWSSADPETGIVEYLTAVGTSPGGSNIADWASAGTSTAGSRTGLTLAEGTTYYFSVKAINGAGGYAIGSSDGITADASAPATPVVTDDGEYTSSTDALHATWSASEPHSGITEYQYAVGTSPGGTDITDWTSTGTTAEVTKTGLSLTEGTTYYFAVKARNGAGMWSETGMSDGISVDDTPPTAPMVTDDGAYTANATQLHATWTEAADPESGISEYEYAIGTTSGGRDVADWTSTGTAREVTETGLSLTDGTTCYFSVRAKSGAGAWSDVALSDGITVDASAPATPTVTDDGQFTSSTSSLHASWTASDPQSGIGEYQYAIGTTSGGTDVVDWTSTGTTAEVTNSGLTLSDGTTYYFTVKAKNSAGLWGSVGVSDGVTVDTTPASTPSVTDDGQYVSSMSVLHAAWSASDAQSGIAEYQYAIGTTPGGVEVVGWTSTGTVASVTRTGLTLADGNTYYISVKAKNGAGLWSGVGTSDGIVLPPAVATITQAKLLTNESYMRISGKIVTAGPNQLPGMSCLYIEEPDRTSGIKVVTDATVDANSTVQVFGRVTTVSGERQISATGVTVTATGGTPLRPFLVSTLSLGGVGLGPNVPGVFEGRGPHNIGLLVRMSGKVTYSGGIGEDFVYIDDGSALSDGSPHVGVKVYTSSLAKPAQDVHVIVTGISSCEPGIPGSIRRMLALQITEIP